MSEVVDQSLQKIVKGTGIIFTGTIIGMLLGFVGRVLFARFFTQAEYGIFSLALGVLSIAVTFSLLGLQGGCARQIAYYRGKNDSSKVQETLISSIQIALITSIFVSAILFFSSDIISEKIFQEPKLSIPLRIFSMALPFFALIHVFSSIFQGFDEVRPKVYFESILRNGLFLLLLALIILLDLSFSLAMYAFSTSLIVTCIIFAIYTIKKIPIRIKIKLAINPIGRELLFFSLPLLAVTMLTGIILWTDTLMLGYFKTSDVVGLYNAAYPLGRLIVVLFSSMAFIYVPIASGLYSRNLMEEMKRIHAVLTKWVFIATSLLFLLFFLFPETALNLLFGPQYIQADRALQILALGCFINISLGPNTYALLVIGRTKLLMWLTLIGTIMNIMLNALLIPPMGITGAAIASAFATALINITALVAVYRLSGIHPFARNYLKLLGIFAVLLSLFYALTFYLRLESWMIAILFIALIFAYLLLLLLAKGFDEEDISLLLALEGRAGINLIAIKRFINRFLLK